MRLFKVTNAYADELKSSINFDMNKLEDIELADKKIIRDVCANCNERIHPLYSYCPYCGNRIG